MNWLTPKELEAADDPNEGLFLAWLLPSATTVIVVGVIRICTYMGWLQ